MDEAGTPLAVTTAVPDNGGLAALACRIAGFNEPVHAAIESMNGARFVHDQLEVAGWQVEIADAQKLKAVRAAARDLAAQAEVAYCVTVAAWQPTRPTTRATTARRSGVDVAACWPTACARSPPPACGPNRPGRPSGRQHLPQGRHQAGDRHLKFHDVRGNLPRLPARAHRDLGDGVVVLVLREPPEPSAGRSAGVEIRVGVTTLLDLDERPGEIPGWGPILPAVARNLVGRYRRARWRFAVLDNDGHLLLAGTTRHRPTAAEHPLPVVEGGGVELHVTAQRLATLADNPAAHPAWAAVIADTDAQFADRRQRRATLSAHPDSRHGRGPLLRHIQVRDRTCVAPGCRRAARRCDADHTHAHTDGGHTTAANTGPLCPRHHALKHHGGWQLRQPRPGHFHWRSPLGEHYTTRGEPIMPPLPAPHPGPLPPEPPTAGPRYVEGPSYDARPPSPPPATDPGPRRHAFWKRPPPKTPRPPHPSNPLAANRWRPRS